MEKTNKKNWTYLSPHASLRAMTLRGELVGPKRTVMPPEASVHNVGTCIHSLHQDDVTIWSDDVIISLGNTGRIWLT